MGALEFGGLPPGALLAIDSAPIIYVVERHPQIGARFQPLFEAQDAGRFRFAVSVVTISEVLMAPMRAGDETLTQRYRAMFDTWQVVDVDRRLCETAARLRASYRLKLADAIVAASALATNAAALVTYDRDFSRVSSLRVIS